MGRIFQLSTPFLGYVESSARILMGRGAFNSLLGIPEDLIGSLAARGWTDFQLPSWDTAQEARRGVHRQRLSTPFLGYELLWGYRDLLNIFQLPSWDTHILFHPEGPSLPIFQLPSWDTSEWGSHRLHSLPFNSLLGIPVPLRSSCFPTLTFNSLLGIHTKFVLMLFFSDFTFNSLLGIRNGEVIVEFGEADFQLPSWDTLHG